VVSASVSNRALGLHGPALRTGGDGLQRVVARASVARTGLDHVSFGVAGRAALETWAAWLDELGISHTGVVDETTPITYSTVVFRDPDNIQLELIAMD
jgi:catechol 2,3-dioxygenase-like lactoylglutathione lyase family enzyme